MTNNDSGQGSVSELVEKSKKAFDLGDWQRAAESAIEVVSQRPNDPDANRILGSLAAYGGDLRSAEACFRRVIEADSNAFDAMEWLANIHRTTGRVPSAANLCNGMIKLRPELPGPYTCLGLCDLELGKIEEALLSLEKAVQLDPGSAMFHNNLAVGLSRAGRAEAAMGEYREAVRLAPSVGDFRFALAKLLIDTQRIAEAVDAAREAVRAEPGVRTQLLLAKALDLNGDVGGSEEAYQFASEKYPDSSEVADALGAHHMEHGKFAEAEGCFERSISLKPNSARPYFEITRCRRIEPSDTGLVDRMKVMAAEADRPLEEMRLLQYALGKAYDDLGDYAQAMAEFDKANRNAKKLQLQQTPFSLSRMKTYVDDLISAFNAELFDGRRDVGSASNKPIFIVGMIRSGTTLIDQLLSSHPQIGAAGEVGYWSGPRAVDAIVSISKGRIDSKEIRDLAQGYLDQIDRQKPDCLHITDKMPLNYLSLGLIHLAFPDARIIHCKRNPLDTCLSIYMTPFAKTMEFFYDKMNIADAYLEYKRLMAHWREVIPTNRFYEVEYEELVTDKETTLPALVGFLGLEWHEGILHHERNKNAIRTPSQWQARQPIYSTSVERWRRYEPWLGEFRELIDID
jgi:tetratricopeptide (TPR) repeat protein